MVNQYIIIVGKKDEERFRRFRTNQDSGIIQSIPKLYGSKSIWALGSSSNFDLWTGIKKNDLIFFAEANSSFKHYGIVSNKLTDKNISIKLWGDTPRMREHKFLILFHSINDIDESFNQLCRKAGVNPSGIMTNIYRVKNKTSITLPITTSGTTGMVFVNGDGTPDKKSEVVTRFIRDTRKVKQLKAKYVDRCQICDYTITTSKNFKYSEVHHLRPLKDNGDDNFSNMLVLCPTHHVEFDYKVIGIDRDKKTIIDKNGRDVSILTFKNGHKLDVKNIMFHLQEMIKQ